MVNSTLTLSCTFAGIEASITGKASDPDQVARELTTVINVLKSSEAAGRLITARQIANRFLPDLATRVIVADAETNRAAEPVTPAPAPANTEPDEAPAMRVSGWGQRSDE